MNYSLPDFYFIYSNFPYRMALKLSNVRVPANKLKDGQLSSFHCKCLAMISCCERLLGYVVQLWMQQERPTSQSVPGFSKIMNLFQGINQPVYAPFVKYWRTYTTDVRLTQWSNKLWTAVLMFSGPRTPLLFSRIFRRTTQGIDFKLGGYIDHGTP